MESIFDLNKKDLRTLKRFFKESPVRFRQATAGVLNSLAFSTRKYDIENIEKSMTVRNKRFVQSSIRVDKARSGSIESQVAYTYSIQKGNFTGWAEQQLNTRTQQKKQFTDTGRGGSPRRRVPAKYRMKKGKKFLRSSTITPSINKFKDEYHRTVIFMAMMRRRKKEPFYIDYPIGKMKRGLYIVEKGQIKRIAKTEDIKNPKRIRWRTQSITKLKSKNDIRTIWQDNIDRAIKNAKR